MHDCIYSVLHTTTPFHTHVISCISYISYITHSTSAEPPYISATSSSTSPLDMVEDTSTQQSLPPFNYGAPAPVQPGVEDEEEEKGEGGEEGDFDGGAGGGGGGPPPKPPPPGSTLLLVLVLFGVGVFWMTHSCVFVFVCMCVCIGVHNMQCVYRTCMQSSLSSLSPPQSPTPLHSTPRNPLCSSHAPAPRRCTQHKHHPSRRTSCLLVSRPRCG